MAAYRACTPFCNKLRSLGLQNGKLPSRQYLLQHLELVENDREFGERLGTLSELRDRTHCNFCQLVVKAVESSADQWDKYEDNASQSIDVLLFPDEQAFRLSYPSRFGTKLAFVAEEDGKITGPDNARPVINTQVRAAQITGWLAKCDTYHSKSCSNQNQGYRSINEHMTSNFRLLDLELGCVKRVPLHTRYVTLSYVWGQLPTFKLLKSNLDLLETEASIDNIKSNLPRTVADAMSLVKAIGERYLWVDTLCLIQDDEEDLKLGIQIMNSIYQGSYFTIVAGSGADAGAGLPGVQADSRRSQQMILEVGADLKMTITHSIDWHLSRSVYNRRCWTLQELALPKRTLVFINDQVYFRCQEANWSEESGADLWTHSIDLDDSNIIRIPDPSEGLLPAMWAYQKLCEDYSRRQLRFDGDALRGIAAILRLLSAGAQTSILEGLPSFFLDQALKFISSCGNSRRRPQFPSFSWAGWAGQVMWPRGKFVWSQGLESGYSTNEIVESLEKNAFIEWNALHPSGTLESLSYTTPNEASKLVKLMHSFPNVFPKETIDSAKEPLGIRPYATIRSSSHLGPSSSAKRCERRHGVSLSDLNLVNSQAEFIRVAQKIQDPREKLLLSNWLASRAARLRRPRSSQSSETWDTNYNTRPLSIAHEWENKLYEFRELSNSESHSTFGNDHVKEIPRGDERALVAQRYSVKASSESESSSIPSFPRYAVLYFRAISIHLILGETSQRDIDPVIVPPTHSAEAGRLQGHGPSSFDRISGRPLLSPAGELVGSLHPDNLDLLSHKLGTNVECILISRASVLTIGSALSASTASKIITSNQPDADYSTDQSRESTDDIYSNQRLESFWGLCIVWNRGIAERRGSVQVLPSALENACEPGPEIKTILLG
ncbi:MAG: hypothetical protein Q9227_001397 [Pyrenula ochraceoflavens]